MAIQVNRASKKDIGAITGIFMNPPAGFRMRNLETNILNDIDWSGKRLAAQSNAGGIFAAKDNGALVGFGMPVTYDIQIMGNKSMVEMQAAFAGNQQIHGGEKAAIASYRACYESANFVLFLPHETKDAATIYRLLLGRIIEAARAMPGIRRIKGAMPKEHGEMAESLGMKIVANTETVYETAFDGKKIRPRKITLYAAGRESAGMLGTGPNEDGKIAGKKVRNFC
ncbi:MAG: hypothetical protein NTX79_06915 [Candidatus Micrarchaeota archaeon]|nr:hypothetical protein [Candidatus Micrarchaeota archaeon]